MKARAIEGFGDRLAQIRKSRAMTQIELGKRVGVSNRVIAYYETESTQPPGSLLVDLARELEVTTDELLGLKPLKAKTDPKSARLMNRLKKVEALSPAEQRTVLKLVDTLAAARGNATTHRDRPAHRTAATESRRRR